MPTWVAVGLGLLGVGVLFYYLGGVLTPVAAAFFIAYLLDPVVDRFEAMRVPRAVGIVLVLSILFAALALFLLVTVPGVIRDISEFGERLPEKLAALRDRLEPLLQQAGIDHFPTSVQDFLDELEAHGAEPQQIGEQVLGPLAYAVRVAVGSTVSALGAIVAALIIPVLAFYLLYDFDRIVAAAGELVPHRVRPFVFDVTKEVDQVLSHFIRGQLIVMVLLGVMYSVGYWLIGIKLALVIGIIAGLVSFIPYVGSALALILALIIVALDTQDLSQALWVVGVYAVIQLLEGFVITPKVVGEQVGLAAVWVLLALMAGGELFGFFGVLIALPAAAVLKVFVVRAVAWYKKSDWFLADEAPATVLAGILREEGFPDSAETQRAKRPSSGQPADEREGAGASGGDSFAETGEDPEETSREQGES